MELDNVQRCCSQRTQACFQRFWVHFGLGGAVIQHSCLLLIDALKDDAEAHLQQGSLDQAEECYNLSLNAIDAVRTQNKSLALLPHDLAIILSNRSFVRCKQGKYTDALEDAETCIKLAANYTKGYWRASQALKALSQYGKAAYYLTVALSEEITYGDFECFISELAILIPQIKNKAEYKICEDIPINTTSSLPLWTDILNKLCDHHEYEAVAILTTGICDSCQVTSSQVHNLASIPGLCLGFISVGRMVQFLSQKEGTKAWHLKLAEFVVKRGADISTVADVFMQPLLVVMTSLSIEAEVPSFLLLAWDKLSPLEYDKKDSQGNTPVHIVAKHKKNSKSKTEVICRDLLAHGCLATEVDKAGKLAHEYVPPEHVIHKQLKNALAPSDGVKQRLQLIREDGRKAVTNKAYDKAIELYQMALSIASHFTDLNTDVAILNSNLSAVYTNKQDYTKAVKFADDSLKADPQYCKGYYRKGQALVKLGKYRPACEAFILGFHKSHEDSEKFNFSLEVAKIVCHIPDADNYLTRDIKGMLVSTWPKVIESLTQQGMWVELSSLILGPPFDNVGRTGIMATCDASRAVLSTVFESLTNGKVKFPLLLVVLLRQGALPASLATSKKETHFHAAVRFCLLTNDITLLIVILEKAVGKDFQSSRDSEHRTPLHTLCIESERIRADHNLCFKIAKLLVEKKIDISVKDKYNRSAVDYVMTNAPLKQLMKSGFAKPDSAGPRSTKTWSDLKEMGNVAFKQEDYKRALQLYSEAISHFKSKLEQSRNVMSKEDGRNLAVLYGNRAECWYKERNLPMFLDDAKESVNADGSWYKGHWRVAKAFKDQGKGEKAIRAFFNSLTALTSSEEFLKIRILSDLVETIYEQKDGREAYMEKLKDIPFDQWRQLSYDFIVSQKWGVAEFIYRNRDPLCAVSKNFNFDLSPFCKMDLLDNQRWICGFLRWFLTTGSDHRTLKFHAGDTYFHATISIIVLSGSNPTAGNRMDSDVTHLLDYIVTNKVLPSGHINIRDHKDNTVLHLLATLKGPPKMRHFLACYLLEKGVDVLAKNGDNKQVLELVSSFDVIRPPIQEILNKQKFIDKLKDQKKPDRNSAPIGQDRNSPRDNVSPQKTSQECHSCEKRLEKASVWHAKENYYEEFSELVDVINCSSSESLHHKALTGRVVQRVATLLSYNVAHEVPAPFFKIHAAKFKDVLIAIAISGNWVQAEALMNKFKQSKGQHAMSKFAKSVSLADLVTDPSLVDKESVRLKLINLFVKQGVTVDPAVSASTLEAAVRNSEWQVALKLLEIGADPRGLTLTSGDTPYHVALQVALHKDPGNFLLLEKLKDIYESSKTVSPFLDVSCQDKDGNTLLHIAAQAKFNHHSLRAVELLCQWKVKADIKNKEGKLVIQYIQNDKDRRAQYLKTASKGLQVSAPNYAVSSNNEAAGADVSNCALRTNVSAGTSGTNVSSGRPGASVSSGPRPKASAATAMSSIQLEKVKIQNQLTALPNLSYNFLTEGVNKGVQKHEEDAEDSDEDSDQSDSDTERGAEFGASDDQELAEGFQNMSATEELTVSAKAFESLEWEIECTEDVWNVLKLRKEKVKSNKEENKHKNLAKNVMSPSLKQKVVNCIYKLASGDWQSHLKQKVQSTPDSLQLFRITLSHGAYILWELAVAFSPRLNQNADTLLTQETVRRSGSSTKTPRVYSEVIRIWSIVLEQSKLQPEIQRIISSHERGKKCIIQKRIKALNARHFDQSLPLRLPVLYTEQDIDQRLPDDMQQDLQRCLFPPASAHKNEYHVLKFYSFSASLVSAVLDKLDANVDFPFRVTDIEHAIICLKSAAPLLLLGRSGTGKTTCCLYRLWSIFQHYWEEAMNAGRPLLPRQNYPEIKENNEEDVDGEVTTNLKEGGHAAQEFKLTSKTDYDIQDQGNDSESDENIDSENPDDDDNDDDGALYDHLHQVFVTKNPVLCLEVQKSFTKLCNATDLNQRGHINGDLPNTIQDVSDSTFPLFLTSRQLLLMLDASVDGDSFFPRNEDLALKVHIPGWGTQEDIFSAIPLEHDDLLDSDNEDGGYKDKGVNLPKRAKHVHNLGNQPELKEYARRECTYEVFAYEVWPKIAKKAEIDCHPSLVWTEIMSFIKGSYESLYTEKGYLDKEEYINLGRKRAPNFSGNRSEVYDVFLKYHNYRQQHSLFDEADLVFKLYCRLRKMTFQPWILHEIYVDETQDFTQAELALLVSLCSEPNKMFLTGDTAQSIMRGISFRFHDLRSLFYSTKKLADKKERHLSSLKVPEKVHQLTHNYRSHTGILSLASSVLDILIELFPDSFDPLEKDQGMFAGPKPILIESSSPGDLALLLTGSRRKTSHIEFGAHQAILVVNERAKAQLPEELGSGIVLTIFESKGLEFDDVLIYNFFKDSHAKKEWRVVTEFLLKFMNTEVTPENVESLVEIDTDVLAQSRTRPLQFDPTQHKILNSELKHLYTAITRARVNVWIFDEDSEKRTPMFEYFKARGLVICMGTEECENVNEAIMFADKSTAKEWKLAGDKYMHQKLYTVAAKCYRLAEKPEKEKVAIAFQTALEASRMKATPKAMRDKYFKSGTQFVECGHLHQAAICFQNSHDFLLAALAFEKSGQFEQAAAQFLRAQDPIKASQCLEQAGMFGRAIRLLADHELFDRAIDCLHIYEMEVKRFKDEGKPVPAVLIENKPSDLHSEGSLCYRSADAHFNRGDKEKAINTIKRSRNTEDQVVFLQKKELWEELAKIWKNQGKTEKAALFMLRSGHTEDALEWAQQGFHKSLTASIHLVMARRYVKNKKNENAETTLEKIKQHATSALIMYTELQDYTGQAMSKMILGKHTANLKQIIEAQHDFLNAKPQNLAGAHECFSILAAAKQNWSSQKDCQEAIKNINQGFSIVHMLLNPAAENSDKHQQCLSFYGLELDAVRQQVMWYPHEYPFCQDFLRPDGKEARCVTLTKEKAVACLEKHFISNIEKWAAMIRTLLEKNIFSHIQCINYKHGQDRCAEDCKYMHKPYESKQEELEALNFLLYSVHLDYCMQTGMEKLGENKPKSDVQGTEMEETKWKSVKELIQFVCPLSPSTLRFQPDTVHDIVHKVQTSKALPQLERYFRYLWNNPGRVGRGVSTNISKERCKSSDWIVQACFFASLFRLKINVKAEVNDLENKLMSSPKKWIYKRFKYALFVEKIENSQSTEKNTNSRRAEKNTTNQSVMVKAIGSRFLESFEYLTKIPQNLYEALFPFTRMISGLGIRGNLSLMPELDHLLFWIEFYLSLTWMFISKVNHSSGKRIPFYLINSYFSNMHLVSECIENSEGQPKTIQQLIILPSKPRIQNRHILDRQDFIVNFLVGHNKYSEFGLISQVKQLCQKEQRNYLLAERIIVLSALVLLNIPGQYAYLHQEVPIRRELFKLTVTKTMPTRLASLITGLKNAAGYEAVAATVLEFLHKQGSDRLIVGQCLQQERYSIQFHVAKLSDCASLKFMEVNIEEEALKSMKMDERHLSQGSHFQNDDQGISEEMDEKDIERQQAKLKSAKEEYTRKSAVKMIVQFLKSVVMQSRLKKKTYLTYEMDEMFRPSAVTDSYCGVCGVDLEPNETRDSEGDESRSRLTKEKHCRTDDHKKKLDNFQAFKSLYQSEVHHQREEILRFLSVYKVDINSPIYKDSELYTMKILKAAQDFSNILQDILHSRNWLDSQKMLDAFNYLTKCFKENCEQIKKAFKEYQHKEERQHHNQDSMVKEHKEQDQPQDVVDLDPVNPVKEPSEPRSRRQKRNAKQRNRRK